MALKKLRMSFECPKCKHFHEHFESGGSWWRPTVVCAACESQFRPKLAIVHSLVIGTILTVVLLPVVAALAWAVGSGFSAPASWMVAVFVALGFSGAGVAWLVTRRYAKRFIRYETVETNAA